jgi:hypothetical protein
MLTFVHDLGQVTFSIRIFLTIYYKRGLRPIGIFPHTSALGFGTHTKEKEKEKREKKKVMSMVVFLILYLSFGTCCDYIVPFESSLILRLIIVYHEFVAQLKDLLQTPPLSC